MHSCIHTYGDYCAETVEKIGKTTENASTAQVNENQQVVALDSEATAKDK